MQTLVIYLSETNPEVEVVEPKSNPVEINESQFGVVGAEFYGHAWAKLFPADIVMLVEEEE